MVIILNKIFWAGDSTVQYNNFLTYPQTGIGQVFNLFLTEGISVENHARNGRSTKNFIDEKRLEKIEELISEGDFLFIQFGHNDEKKDDPARFTEPDGEFKTNLEIYAAAARNKGAYPVFITPLSRRIYAEKFPGEFTHKAYADGMKETAKKLNVPLIDLYAMSEDAIRGAGEEKSKDWFMYLNPSEFEAFPEGKTDDTHLRYEGAVTFAGLIAKGLKDLGGIYGNLVI